MAILARSEGPTKSLKRLDGGHEASLKSWTDVDSSSLPPRHQDFSPSSKIHAARSRFKVIARIGSLKLRMASSLIN